MRSASSYSHGAREASHTRSAAREREGGLLVGNPTESQAAAQKLSREHTCSSRRWHLVGVIEQIKKLLLLLFWEETGLCCIDVLEGPEWQVI